MKIIILGFSGSGKSTLARQLGKAYDLPVLHLDAIHFSSDWKENTPAYEQQALAQFLDTHNGWVIDGEYSRVHYQRRLEEADQIFILPINRFVRFKRVFIRIVKNYGKSRPDVGEGNLEKFDPAFLKWVLWDGCRPERRRRYTDILARYPEKTTVLTWQTQRLATTYRR